MQDLDRRLDLVYSSGREPGSTDERRAARQAATSARSATDPMLCNSALIFITTVLMAGGGAVFWVIAARLATPGGRRPRRLAGRGRRLDRAVRPARAEHRAAAHDADQRPQGRRRDHRRGRRGRRRRRASRSSTACCCRSPRRACTTVLGSPLAIAHLLRAGRRRPRSTCSPTASSWRINRVWYYLRLNGILLGVAKCALPFLLAGAGALGLYGSVGGAILLCAVGQPRG